MRPIVDQKLWLEEFESFLETEMATVPQSLSEKVNTYVHRQLNPPLGEAFFRLFLIHAVTSLLVLAVCPHFGIQLIPGFGGLPALFMPLGMQFCMFACGGIFMTSGLLCGALLLPIESIQVLKRHGLLVPLLLTLVTCGLLIALGNPLPLLWTFLWLAGGLLGSLFGFKAGIYSRLHLRTS